jgi:hypothetical protein
MQEIINEFEVFFCKHFDLEKTTDKGEYAIFELDPTLSIKLFAQCGISTKKYISRLLSKYYAVSPVNN